MASFHVYGFLISLLILNVATEIPTHSNDKNADGFNKCMKFGVCKCEDYGPWEQCWDMLMLETRKEIITKMKTTDGCGEIDNSHVKDDVPFMDMANGLCNTPPKQWDACYESLKTVMGKYVDEAAKSKEEGKKKENSQIDKARKCTMAVVSGRCNGMDIGECPEDF